MESQPSHSTLTIDEESHIRLLQSDILLNQSVVNTFSYTLTGLGAGLALCLFFKKPARMIRFSTGAGFGWGLVEFKRDLEAHPKIRL